MTRWVDINTEGNDILGLEGKELIECVTNNLWEIIMFGYSFEKESDLLHKGNPLVEAHNNLIIKPRVKLDIFMSSITIIKKFIGKLVQIVFVRMVNFEIKKVSLEFERYNQPIACPPEDDQHDQQIIEEKEDSFATDFTKKRMNTHNKNSVTDSDLSYCNNKKMVDRNDIDGIEIYEEKDEQNHSKRSPDNITFTDETEKKTSEEFTDEEIIEEEITEEQKEDSQSLEEDDSSTFTEVSSAGSAANVRKSRLDRNDLDASEKYVIRDSIEAFNESNTETMIGQFEMKDVCFQCEYATNEKFRFEFTAETASLFFWCGLPRMKRKCGMARKVKILDKIPFNFSMPLASVKSTFKFYTDSVSFNINHGLLEAFFSFLGNMMLIGAFVRQMRTFNENMRDQEKERESKPQNLEIINKQKKANRFKDSLFSWILNPKEKAQEKRTSNTKNYKESPTAAELVDKYNKTLKDRLSLDEEKNSHYVRTDQVPLFPKKIVVMFKRCTMHINCSKFDDQDMNCYKQQKGEQIIVKFINFEVNVGLLREGKFQRPSAFNITFSMKNDLIAAYVKRSNLKLVELHKPLLTTCRRVKKQEKTINHLSQFRVNFKVEKVYFSYNSYSMVIGKYILLIMQNMVNKDFAVYKEYVERWLEDNKKLYKPKKSEVYKLVSKIEEEKKSQTQSILKDTGLKVRELKNKYKADQGIFEVHLEFSYQVNEFELVLYDKDNKQLITQKLYEYYNKMNERFPYEMFWQQLNCFKNIYVYSHEGCVNCQLTDQNNPIYRKRAYQDFYLQVPPDKKSMRYSTRHTKGSGGDAVSFMNSMKPPSSDNTHDDKSMINLNDAISQQGFKKATKHIIQAENMTMNELIEKFDNSMKDWMHKDHNRFYSKNSNMNIADGCGHTESCKQIGKINKYWMFTSLDGKNDEKLITLSNVKINFNDELLIKLNEFRLNFMLQQELIGLNRRKRMRHQRIILFKNWEAKKDYLSRYDIQNIEIGLFYGESRKAKFMIESITKERSSALKDMVNQLSLSNLRQVIETVFEKTDGSKMEGKNKTPEETSYNGSDFHQASGQNTSKKMGTTPEKKHIKTKTYIESPLIRLLPPKSYSSIDNYDKKSKLHKKNILISENYDRLFDKSFEQVNVQKINILKSFNFPKDFKKDTSVVLLTLNPNRFQKITSSYYLMINIENPDININHDFPLYSKCIKEFQDTQNKLGESNKEILSQNRKVLEQAKDRINMTHNPNKDIVPFSGKYFISFKNFVFNIEDKPMETFQLRHQKFVRDYLSKNENYEETLVIQVLKDLKKQKHGQLTLTIEEIALDFRSPDFKNYLQECWNKMLKLDMTLIKANIEQLSGLTAIRDRIAVFGISLTIRDFPLPIIALKFFSITGTHYIATWDEKFCDTECFFGRTKIYYNFEIKSETLEFNFGLNVLSGINSIKKFFIESLSESLPDNLQNDIENTTIISENSNLMLKGLPKHETEASRRLFENFTVQESFKKERSLTEFYKSSKRPTQQLSQTSLTKLAESGDNDVKWWDLSRFKYHGFIHMSSEDCYLRILTNTSPYQSDNLQLYINTATLRCRSPELKILIKEINFQRMMDSCNKSNDYAIHTRVSMKKPKNESHIFKLPLAEFLIKWNFADEKTSLGHYFFQKEYQQCQKSKTKSFIAQSLSFDISCNFPKSNELQKDMEKDQNKDNIWETFVKKSQVPIIHFQSNLMNFQINMPQLRHEYLIQHNIRPLNHTEQEPHEIENNANRSSTDRVNEDKDKGIPGHSSNTQAIYSNYQELMAYTLNEQQNINPNNNLLMLISEIKFKQNITSTRIIYSNKQRYYNVVSKKNEEEKNLNEYEDSDENSNSKQQFLQNDEHKIYGLQTVLDSVSFCSTFFKKPIKLIASQITKIKKKIRANKGRFRWAARGGFGKINMVYGGMFDGVNLLPLKSNGFQKRRESNYKYSMNNPKNFCEFFGINQSQRNDRTTNEVPLIFDTENHLFEMTNNNIRFKEAQKSPLENVTINLRQQYSTLNTEKDINSLKAKMQFGDYLSPNNTSMSAIQMTNQSNQSGRLFTSDNLNTNFSTSFASHQTRLSPDAKNLNQSNGSIKVPTEADFDFQFSTNGIQFKADLLIYEQSKESFIEVENEANKSQLQNIKVRFMHYQTIKGCKTLICMTAKTILINLFYYPFEDTINRKRLEREKERLKKDANVNQSDKNSNLHKMSGNSAQNNMDILENIQYTGIIDNLFVSSSSAKTKDYYMFGFNLEKPEFNLYNHDYNTQLLAATKNSCKVLIVKHILPYDKFQQDPKYMIKLFFSNLEWFTAPTNVDMFNRIYWLSDTKDRNFMTASKAKTHVDDFYTGNKPNSNNSKNSAFCDNSPETNFNKLDKILKFNSNDAIDRKKYETKGSIENEKLLKSEVVSFDASNFNTNDTYMNRVSGPENLQSSNMTNMSLNGYDHGNFRAARRKSLFSNERKSNLQSANYIIEDIPEDKEENEESRSRIESSMQMNETPNQSVQNFVSNNSDRNDLDYKLSPNYYIFPKAGEFDSKENNTINSEWKKSDIYDDNSNQQVYRKKDCLLTGVSHISTIPIAKIDTKRGQLFRIIQCDRAFFTYTTFNLNECLIDFSRPLELGRFGSKLFQGQNHAKRMLWNNKFRINCFSINVGQLTATMDSIHFDSLQRQIEFLMQLSARKQNEAKNNEDIILEAMRRELKELGLDGQKKYMEMKAQNFIEAQHSSKNNAKRRWTFEYFVSNVVVRMTKNEKVFLNVNIGNLSGEHCFEDGGCDMTFKIKKIKVENPGAKDPKEQVILRRVNDEEDDTYTVTISQQYFIIQGNNPQVSWRIVNNFEIILAPLILNLSTNLAKLISEYVFHRENKMIHKLDDNEEEEMNRLWLQNPDLYVKAKELMALKKKLAYKKENKKNNSKNGKKPKLKGDIIAPVSLYKRIRIADQKLYITYHSSNLLMNLNNMKMFQDPIDRFNKMYSRKEFSEKLIKLVKKGALTSILKYKCLGIRGKM